MLWQVRKPKFRFSDQTPKGNQFSPLWRTGFQEGTETGIPLGRLDFTSKQKTSAHHRLHPCNLNLHLQGWAECPDVKNNPGHPGNLQDVQDDPSPMGKRTKFSTTSFQLRPWSPPMGLPPPPRNMRSGYLRVYFLLISGSFFMLNFHFHEEKNSLEARLVVTVNVETIHVQASYQRRSQRQHFSVNSGEFRINLCDFPLPFQNVYKVC